MELVVVKIGGALLAEETTKQVFWKGIQSLAKHHPTLIVHGGGPQATKTARMRGHEPQIVHGRRVTTALDLEIMIQVVSGEINKNLVASASKEGINSVGLSGIDGQIITVEKRPPWKIDGERIDFGWVGDIVAVKAGLLTLLLRNSYVPIISPLGVDGVGNMYNVNADTIALAIAKEMNASQFLLVTETGGVKKNLSEVSVLPEIDRALFMQGQEEGWIAGGMKVKLNVGFEALDFGIGEVRILAPEDLIENNSGTVLKRNETER